MFDDILEISENLEKLCKNCRHASRILSNYPDKILCQKKKRHYVPEDTCNFWEKRIYNNINLEKNP